MSDVKEAIDQGEFAMKTLADSLDVALEVCKRTPARKAEWRRLLPTLAALKRATRKLTEEIER